MRRRTVVVEGPIAIAMRRKAAARYGEVGLQIMTLPQLAARLVGGFARPARPQDLDPVIRASLEGGGFAELESARRLPGMVRSVGQSLRRVWESDVQLSRISTENARLADLAEIEKRVLTGLPAGVLAPQQLRDAAVKRSALASKLFGTIDLEGIVTVAPVWRVLLKALEEHISICWYHPDGKGAEWFTGGVICNQTPKNLDTSVVSCANPRAEVVEALRWVRELIASRAAQPEEVAIVATSTVEWDRHFLVLAEDAGLPLHFGHGIPALATRAGQACAALADVLINGISQDRVRRTFRHASRGAEALDGLLPGDWLRELRTGAALFELHQWRAVLQEMSSKRSDGIELERIIVPVLELFAQGPNAASVVGKMLLDRPALQLWTEALRRGPAEALELTLQHLRASDGRDPSASVVWSPATYLAAAPRRWVRLLGLTARSWPRRMSEDPLIPAHVLDWRKVRLETIAEQDRRSFRIITSCATAGCILSMSRRNAQGGLMSPSPLIPSGVVVQHLKRARIPAHAFSDVDRLFARPQEATLSPAVAIPNLCWRNWHRSNITAHDGIISPDHPLIIRSLDTALSATSLRSMIRDPQAFVWRYVLDCRQIVVEDQPLTIDARTYGELVHELLRRTVDLLEPEPGYTRASRDEIEAALTKATFTVRDEWVLKRAVPPSLLWRSTLEAAGELALIALTLDPTFQPGTRSWTEVAFGDPNPRASRAAPWASNIEVKIPGTKIRLRGAIDRLDLAAGGLAVRVSDYKTGVEPANGSETILGGGSELQRAVYALAAQQLLSGKPRVVARLIFLRADEPRIYPLEDVDQTIKELGSYVTAATLLLRRGLTLPGPDARASYNEFRLALPAMSEIYFQNKQEALNKAFGDFSRVWSRP